MGDVLWSMTGIRQDGKIKWYARPTCIEYVDKHKFLDAWHCGGSWNNIGYNYFLTRDEAIAHFTEKGRKLEEDIDPNRELSEEQKAAGIKEKARTDWQTYEVYRFNGVDMTSIYLNGFNGLIDVTKQAPWRHQLIEWAGEAWETLTLDEIYQHFAKDGQERAMITVFCNGPGKCRIFQCGNYKNGKWVKLGEVMGYA